MANQTMTKFGYPDSVVGETTYWCALLRPRQLTAGCLVLVCKEDGMGLGEISPEAGAELPMVASRIEAAVGAAFNPEKFNYLALMMNDPHVHFHVIPRYSRIVEVGGAEIPDPTWPKPPDMGAAADLTDDQMATMHETLKDNWPR
ncbi:MAG: HIT family protein [Rhodospirillales bacterium]|jgi:diadenosine tetraphosphate (Ap4A) HIT family hydrolase|nr:HIT family protein [Rhodospirillales bacterium]MDP6883838.1 HIT family protein [Rhodospirillales bacterium]